MQNVCTADEAIKKLKDGNRDYVASVTHTGDTSPDARKKSLGGQSPYAVIVACSDSRIIPEYIFSATIGDLFVIRVAGNVIDRHQLGSIEYAVGHLGCNLVAVLGHDNCGAVNAAIHDHGEDSIKFVTDEIKSAIGEEKDDLTACKLNVAHSVQVIKNSPAMQKYAQRGVKIIGAVYLMESGEVQFI